MAWADRSEYQSTNSYRLLIENVRKRKTKEEDFDPYSSFKKESLMQIIKRKQEGRVICSSHESIKDERPKAQHDVCGSNTNNLAIECLSNSNIEERIDIFKSNLNEARRLICEINAVTDDDDYYHEPDICHDKIEIVSYMINDLRNSKLHDLKTVDDVRLFISYAGDVKRIFDEYETLSVQKYIRQFQSDTCSNKTMSDLKNNIASLSAIVQNLDAHSKDAKLKSIAPKGSKHKSSSDSKKSTLDVTSDQIESDEFTGIPNAIRTVEGKVNGKTLVDKIKSDIKAFQKTKDVILIAEIVNSSKALLNLAESCCEQLESSEKQSINRRMQNIKHFVKDLSRLQALPLQSKVKSFLYDIQTLGDMIDKQGRTLSQEECKKFNLLKFIDVGDSLRKGIDSPGDSPRTRLRKLQGKNGRKYKKGMAGGTGVDLMLPKNAFETIRQTMREIFCDVMKTLIKNLNDAKNRTSAVEERMLKKNLYETITKMKNLPVNAMKCDRYVALYEALQDFYTNFAAFGCVVYGTTLVEKIPNVVNLLEDFIKYLETHPSERRKRNQGRVLKHWMLVANYRHYILPFENEKNDRRVIHIERVCKCKIRMITYENNPSLFNRIPDGYQCIVISYDENKGNYYGSMKMISSMYPAREVARFLKQYKTLIRLPNGKRAMLTNDEVLLKTESIQPPSRILFCPRLLALSKRMQIEDTRTSSFLSIPGYQRSSRVSRKFSRPWSSQGFVRDVQKSFDTIVQNKE